MVVSMTSEPPAAAIAVAVMWIRLWLSATSNGLRLTVKKPSAAHPSGQAYARVA